MSVNLFQIKIMLIEQGKFNWLITIKLINLERFFLLDHARVYKFKALQIVRY